MLSSDAPKPVDNVYIPQDKPKKVHQSEEASDEGGGFSFVFYDQKGKSGKKGQQTNKPVDIGEAVKVHISQDASAEKNEPENKEAKENVKSTDQEEEKKPPESGGHINITV